MTTALASLMSGRPVKHNVGMTGEVTLQGRVLPIGGLKQKVLAAHAAGLTDVILPERNRGDLDDVPEEVREQMTFHPVMTVDEVLELALEPAPVDVAAGGVRPSEEIRAEIGALPGVTAEPHRFGGTEYRYGRRELGHVHGDRFARPAVPAALPGRAGNAPSRSTGHTTCCRIVGS